MTTRNAPQEIVTKELKTITSNYGDLSIAEKNARFTRIVLRTHNDFHKHKFWEICLVLNGLAELDIIRRFW